MKKALLFSVLMSFSFNSFAFTQAEALRATFNSDELIKSIANDSIESVKVAQNGNNFNIIINEKAPLVDGCSYEVKVVPERYAIDRLTTGIRLTASSVDENCGW